MSDTNQENGKAGQYWNIGSVKRRGWTKSLIRDLLPPPVWIRVGGRLLPAWKREDVLLKEQDPAFQAPVRNGTPFRIEVPVQTCQRLKTAWEAAAKEETPAWALAGKYHEAIFEALETRRGIRKLRESQAAACLGEFLALERHCDARTLPGVLKRFVRCGLWMEEHPRERQTAQALDRYAAVLYAAASFEAAAFADAQPQADLKAVLGTEGFPLPMLLNDGLASVWSVWYVPTAIRTSLTLLVALNPKDEYPEARAMRRHFILHLGGTNTGKTYAGFQRLILARTGIYLAPLRLLALEAQETLLDAGVACSLTTGEEEDCREEDTHVAATAEKLDLKACYDVAVVDECQMIADRQRGYAWTRAILGVLAPEIHLCAAPEAKNLLIRLIESCGDTWEVELHRRQTPLVCMSHPVDFEHVQPGDALITFSKVGVLSVAEDLRQSGKEPAIIYGALPYSTRRRQMEGFLSGQMRYVVATDAIGMGLNLPIRRIIFMDTLKFDGVERRKLKPSEIQQIAGRAGRYGMYDRGYVGATENLGAVREGLETTVPPLQSAVAGFSDLVLRVDFDLLEVLTEWSKMPAEEPYEKLDISRYLSVIGQMREKGFLLSREQELRAANIPFDETDPELRLLFYRFLSRFRDGEPVEQPGAPENANLPELELYCRKLDLYFSFCKAFGYPVDEDRLYDSREQAAEEINEILLYRLRNNIRFCAKCGKALPLHHRGQLCDACYREKRKPAPVWMANKKK